MRLLLANLVLAIAWALLTGVVTLANLVVGFVLGYLALRIVYLAIGPAPYFARFPRIAWYLLLFLWELLLANLRIAYDVITPRHHMRPGVVAVPLDVKSDMQILLLTSLITLTPGTLALTVSQDRKTLYLHVMYLTSPQELRDSIKNGLERRVLEVTQ